MDLLGVSRPIITAKAFDDPCVELAVILNACVFCSAQEIKQISQEAIERVSSSYNLTITIFKQECFPVIEGS